MRSPSSDLWQGFYVKNVDHCDGKPDGSRRWKPGCRLERNLGPKGWPHLLSPAVKRRGGWAARCSPRPRTFFRISPQDLHRIFKSPWHHEVRKRNLRSGGCDESLENPDRVGDLCRPAGPGIDRCRDRARRGRGAERCGSGGGADHPHRPGPRVGVRGALGNRADDGPLGRGAIRFPTVDRHRSLRGVPDDRWELGVCRGDHGRADLR